jgi:hypothetical protein
LRIERIPNIVLYDGVHIKFNIIKTITDRKQVIHHCRPSNSKIAAGFGSIVEKAVVMGMSITMRPSKADGDAC